jgi:hypothetical protein
MRAETGTLDMASGKDLATGYEIAEGLKFVKKIEPLHRQD